jgi:ABC-type nitrate/sulfonate/bicarbonate transport system substrate-binding protein
MRLGSLAGAVIAAGLFVLSPALAADVVRVGNSQPTFSFVPLDIGMKVGIFKKHNLDIEKTDFHGSSQLHQAIAAGSIDVGLGAGPEFGFLAKGSPELAVAAMADAPGDLALVVLKNGPIKTVADLKGKRVSMSTRGSLTEWAGRELSRKQGWGPNGMNLVALGSFAAQTAALKTHQIDGMIVEATTAGRLAEDGSGRTLVHFNDIVPNFHIHVMFASNDFIKNHPATLKNFIAGWFDSLDYMRSHKAESVKIASQVLNLSPTLSSSLYDQLMPLYNKTGKFNPKAIDTIADSLVDMGIFPKKPDLKPLYTEKFLPGAS